jgi:hypothetical protein
VAQTASLTLLTSDTARDFTGTPAATPVIELSIVMPCLNEAETLSG